MKPRKFKHQNTTFAEDQPQYQPLPALHLKDPKGQVISCWGLSFKERLKVLFTGRIWVNLMSFNQPLTPSYLSTNRKEMYSHTDDSIPTHKIIITKLKSLINKPNGK